MVQNFHEIADNPIIENFYDKNFVITIFFCDYHHAMASVRTLSLRPQLHVAQRWVPGLVQYC